MKFVVLFMLVCTGIAYIPNKVEEPDCGCKKVCKCSPKCLCSIQK